LKFTIFGLIPVINRPPFRPSLLHKKDSVMNTGKIALVTGGSRGIGKDIVESLAKKGVNIVFTYHTNKDKAEEVLDLVRQSGVQAWAIPLALSNVL
jgi:NAD(P)-dependent dehydrogenase (short-subunit alcohol dehydrogenase family)